jgi:predicted nuclease of restriction endonuclease-like (RecB) superfamily
MLAEAGGRLSLIRPLAPGVRVLRGYEEGLMADRTALSQSYANLLASIKDRIEKAQVRAAVAVNRELVLLYWSIGREILSRQETEGWGKNVIPRLAKDLKASFPEMQGFSPRNLGYMKALAEAWPDEPFL